MQLDAVGGTGPAIQVGMTNANQNGGEVVKPVVGMGATICWLTDREAGTVIAVSKTGKTFTVQIDKATRFDGNGMSDMQDYSYERDPAGITYTVRMTKRGWATDGKRVVLDMRRKYHDFSF
jgi:hypothetical protein